MRALSWQLNIISNTIRHMKGLDLTPLQKYKKCIKYFYHFRKTSLSEFININEHIIFYFYKYMSAVYYHNIDTTKLIRTKIIKAILKYIQSTTPSGTLMCVWKRIKNMIRILNIIICTMALFYYIILYVHHRDEIMLILMVRVVQSS